MSVGIGIALMAVASFTLVPAALTGSIPTTTSRRISRNERPKEFWATCIVMSSAALVGLGMIVVALVA